MSLNLKLNGYYKNGYGEVCGPLQTNHESLYSPFKCAKRAYQSDGCYDIFPTGFDLVEEIVPTIKKEPEMSLKLEYGKYYKDRNGDVMGPMMETPPGNMNRTTCPFYEKGGRTYYPDGAYTNNRSGDPWDLIVECDKHGNPLTGIPSATPDYMGLKLGEEIERLTGKIEELQLKLFEQNEELEALRPKPVVTIMWVPVFLAADREPFTLGSVWSDKIEATSNWPQVLLKITVTKHPDGRVERTYVEEQV